MKPDKLRSDPVERAVLERLFEAANWSPSHGHSEPWRFIVFSGAARRALVEAVVSTMADGDQPTLPPDDPRRAKIERNFLTPPVAIAVVNAPPATPKIVPHEDLISTGIAVQNLMLAARAVGLATYWTSGEKAFHPKMAAFLGLEPGARCLGFVFVGYPAIDWPEGARRPALDKVTWKDG
ncbi:nitroreductase [Myxococcota bacterium]|nr:nitroreductase [Myxococcota bacterium]